MVFVISRSVSRFDKQPCACLQSKLVIQNYELGQSSCLAVPDPSPGLSAAWISPDTDLCAAGLKQSWRLVRETSMGQWGVKVLRLKPLIALSHRGFYCLSSLQSHGSIWAVLDWFWGLWVGTRGLFSITMNSEGLAQLLRAAVVVSATWGHCDQGY